MIVGGTTVLGIWLVIRILLRRGEARTWEMRHHLTDGSLSPREHHYHFAHTALRRLAFEDPDALVTALSAEDAEEFLVRLWKAVGKDVAANAENAQDQAATPLTPDGLEAIPARLAGRPAAVVRLPEPRAATEAHLVAIVLNHELLEPAKPAPEPAVYYFTLEKSFSSDGALRATFCEWDGTAHRNHGVGPAPEPRKFVDAIARHLVALARRPRQTRES
jgi:hypothetical protein